MRNKNQNKLKLIIIFSFLGIAPLTAQTVFGKWKTFDIFDKNKAESIVEIYKQNDALNIKIIEIIPLDHQDDLCKKCSGENKNKPIKGMIILKGAYLKKGVWQGAKVLNAKNGYYYGCNLSLFNENYLKVRGFVGYPIFGKTVFWQRVED